MELNKWLKRKYPKSHNNIKKCFNPIYLKDTRYKVGKLINDVDDYKMGIYFMFKRSNPITSYNYPLHYAIFKCEKGHTLSGYHSINIKEEDFKEILK